MLFMSYKPLESTPAVLPAETTVPLPPPPTSHQPEVVEDDVDAYWRARDGKIARGRDSAMCRHGAKGMCDYCMPLEVNLEIAV